MSSSNVYLCGGVASLCFVVVQSVYSKFDPTIVSNFLKKLCGVHLSDSLIREVYVTLNIGTATICTKYVRISLCQSCELIYLSLERAKVPRAYAYSYSTKILRSSSQRKNGEPQSNQCTSHKH